VLGLPAISLTPCFNDTPQDNLTRYFYKLSLTGFGRRAYGGQATTKTLRNSFLFHEDK